MTELSRPLTTSIEKGQRTIFPLVLSDVDGTVNDEQAPESMRMYTIGPAKEAFENLEKRGFNVGLITARSFAEAKLYQEKLSINGFTICEDGAVIALPHTISFDQEYNLMQFGQVVSYEQNTLLLPTDAEGKKVSVEQIKNFIVQIETKTNSPITSSCTSAPKELMQKAGHQSIEAAKLSQGRLASAYAVGLTEKQRHLAKEMSEPAGIRTFTNPVDNITMFFPNHTHKGHAVEILKRLIPSLFPHLTINNIFLIGIGNNNNDLSFLQNADLPIIVRKKDGTLAIERDNIPSHAVVSSMSFGFGIKESTSLILQAFDVQGFSR
jgi:HAD superfamily hydrolase (TIGR01484 family)